MSSIKFCLLLVPVLLLHRLDGQAISECTATLDRTFRPASMDGIRTLLVQPDGKIVVSRNSTLSRLETNGNADPVFQSSPVNINFYGGSIDRIARQSDGKIVFLGYFNSVNSSNRTGVARVNSDGTLDNSFDAQLNPEAAYLYALGIQPDGKILVGGSFTNAGGAARTNLARLNPDGTADLTFDSHLHSEAGIRSLAIQPDGKILISGGFSEIQGINVTNIARLNTDGSVDPTFRGWMDSPAEGMLVLPDQSVLMHGYFYNVNSGVQSYIARLRGDGTSDTNFTADVRGPIRSMVVQSDGRILIGGDFQQVEDMHFHLLARLFPNGSLDHSFHSGLQMLYGCGDSEYVSALGVQPDGKVIVAGTFFEVNGVIQQGLARLFNDGDTCPGLFSFGAEYQSFSETESNAVLVIRRMGGATNSASVEYFFSEGSATPNVDFLNASGLVTFSAGETSKVVNLPLINDVLVEPGETLVFMLENPSGDAVFQHPMMTEVVIVDDESAGKPGSVDLTYRPSLNGAVVAVAVQPDNKAVIGTVFAPVQGLPRAEVTRLNPDGSPDLAFANPGVVSSVANIALQSDGKILLGGTFSFVGGVERTNLARLNSDGTLDTNFTTTIGFDSPYAGISSILVQSNGQIVILGAFSSVDGTPRGGLARLNADGTLDPSLNVEALTGTGSSGYVSQVLEESDGRLLLAGSFSTVNGVRRLGLARVSSTGVLDTNYNPNLSGTSPNPPNLSAVALQPDGKLLVAGAFFNIRTNRTVNLVRVDAQGMIDSTFSEIIDNWINAIAVGGDGKIYLAGYFNQNCNGVIRLTSNGEIDGNFYAGCDPPSRFSATTLALDLQENLLAGGFFTNFNGIMQPYLVKLRGGDFVGPGSLEFTFNASSASESVTNRSVFVRRVGGTNGPVSATFVIAAKNSSSFFSPSNGTLLFPAGDNSIKEIQITVVDDSIVELQESLEVTLQNPSGGASLGPQVGASLEIINNDTAVEFSSAAFAALENQGVQLIAVRRVGDFTRDFWVDYRTVDESAEAGADYTSSTGRLHFQPGDSDTTLSILILDDAISETNETFRIELVSPINVILGTNAQARITIQDNRSQVEFSSPVFQAVENGGQAILRLHRVLEIYSTNVITVSYRTEDGTAKAGIDYHAKTGSVTFPPFRSDYQFLQIPLIDDAMLDVDKTFRVIITATSPGVTLERNQSSQVIILDDEQGPIAGQMDLSFLSNEIWTNGSATALALNHENEVYLAGRWYGPTENDYLHRFNSSGMRDLNFNPQIQGYVNALVTDESGRLLVAGDIKSINGLARGNFFRLLSDGTLDPAWNTSSFPPFAVSAVRRQPDGKYLLAGRYGNANNGGRRPLSWRLDPNGNVDSTFQVQFSSQYGIYDAINAIEVSPDGKIMVAGNFLFQREGENRPNLARLNPDGTLDLSFNPGSEVPYLSTLLLEDNGKVIASGFPNSSEIWNGKLMVRFLPDGTLDSSYPAGSGPDSPPYQMKRQSDGKILISGSFYNIDGIISPLLARLNPDGTLDQTFFWPHSDTDYVLTLQLDSQEEIYLAGTFNVRENQYAHLRRVHNDAPRLAFHRLVQSLGDGSLNLIFNVFPGREVVLDASDNFSGWTPIYTNTPTTGVLQYQDSLGRLSRFYRLRQAP